MENSGYGRTSRKAHAGRRLDLTPDLLAQVTPAAPRRMAAMVGDRRRRVFGEIVAPTPVDPAGRWVIARAQPGWERHVAADLEEAGFRAYCPLRTEAVMSKPRFGRKPRRLVRQSPVFAPYLFVGSNYGLFEARDHDRVEEVLRDEAGPLTVRPEVIRDLNALALRGFWGDPRRLAEPARMGRGDVVRVTNGPFADFVGVIASLPRELRCAVELDIFGRKTRVDIEACDLEQAGV